jgi:hypothetical protein
MNSIDIETIFTILFVAIDDWYQKKAVDGWRAKPAAKPGSAIVKS